MVKIVKGKGKYTEKEKRKIGKSYATIDVYKNGRRIVKDGRLIKRIKNFFKRIKS